MSDTQDNTAASPSSSFDSMDAASTSSGAVLPSRPLLKTEHELRREEYLVTPKEGADKQLVNATRTRKLHDPSDLVALAEYVQTADNYTRSAVGGKLELIHEQILLLQRQAQDILEQAKRDVELNHAQCNFRRVPGKIYHLYRRTNPNPPRENSPINAKTYFSMLSPQDYRGNPPDEFIASYRLEYDMSWTPVEDIAERERRRQLDPRVLGLDSKPAFANVSQTLSAIEYKGSRP